MQPRRCELQKKQSEKELARVMNEYAFYWRFSEFHVKPPTFLSSGITKSSSYMVMRKITGTCLKSILTEDQSLKHFDKNNIATEKRIELTIMFLRALARMHRKNVIHRDIKLANIIVDLAPNIMKLTILDFGLSTDAQHPDDGRRVGTLLYAPPEMFDNKCQTLKGDIYSAAWVIAMIFSNIWMIDSISARCSGTGKTILSAGSISNSGTLTSKCRHTCATRVSNC